MENTKKTIQILEDKRIIQFNNSLNIPMQIKTKELQLKLFYLIINNGTQINESNETIIIQKSTIMQTLNLNNKNKRNYYEVKKALEEIIKKSFLEFGNDEIFTMGFLFTGVRAKKDTYEISISKQFKPLFLEYKKGYTALLLNETMTFESKYSILLYHYLIAVKDYANAYNGIYLDDEDLFKIFGLSKNDYHDKNGKITRKQLEERIINKAIKEINFTSRIIYNVKITKQYNEYNNSFKCYKITYDNKKIFDVLKKINEEEKIETMKKYIDLKELNKQQQEEYTKKIEELIKIANDVNIWEELK